MPLRAGIVLLLTLLLGGVVLALQPGELDTRLRKAVNDYDYNDYTRALTDFANNDLSAFFFDIRKDCLYCDAPGSPKRRAYRTVLDTLFHALVRWAAPVLVFTAEEVWSTRYPDADSVHLLEWPLIDTEWRDESLEAKWAALRGQREAVTEAIEPLRREKVVGSSLEAEVTLAGEVDSDLLAELFIATAQILPGLRTGGYHVTADASICSIDESARAARKPAAIASSISAPPAITSSMRAPAALERCASRAGGSASSRSTATSLPSVSSATTRSRALYLTLASFIVLPGDQ